MIERKRALILGMIAVSAVLIAAVAYIIVLMPSDGAWERPNVTLEDYEKAAGAREQITTYDLITLVDGNDPYVVEIAQHMGGPQDVLTWMKGHIAAGKDIDIYGVQDHWAKPVETLFNRQADCEDSAVLIASILTAMGYAPELVIFIAQDGGKGHIAVLLDGVYLDQFGRHGQPPIDDSTVASIVGAAFHNGKIEQRIIEKTEIFR